VNIVYVAGGIVEGAVEGLLDIALEINSLCIYPYFHIDLSVEIQLSYTYVSIKLWSYNA